MSLAGLAGVVCHSLKDDLREKLVGCNPYNLVNQPTDPGLAWSPGRELVTEDEVEMIQEKSRARVVNAWIKDKIKDARTSNNDYQHNQQRNGSKWSRSRLLDYGGPEEKTETNPGRIIVICLSVLLLVSIIFLILTTIFTVGQLASRHLVESKEPVRPRPIRPRKEINFFNVL